MHSSWWQSRRERGWHITVAMNKPTGHLQHMCSESESCTSSNISWCLTMRTEIDVNSITSWCIQLHLRSKLYSHSFYSLQCWLNYAGWPMIDTCTSMVVTTAVSWVGMTRIAISSALKPHSYTKWQLLKPKINHTVGRGRIFSFAHTHTRRHRVFICL